MARSGRVLPCRNCGRITDHKVGEYSMACECCGHAGYKR